MARNKSAMKRMRQNLKRRQRNRRVKSSMKTAIKKVYAAMANRDEAATQEALRNAISLIDKAATKGVIHRNTAARKVSRLTRHVHKALSSPLASA
ncbi:MAG: 30S ribosomal protein S20 [Nitrospinota bacterium]|nr:MAG: 30S ribosomal protein S20 [Nitrospinota bacterium]